MFIFLNSCWLFWVNKSNKTKFDTESNLGKEAKLSDSVTIFVSGMWPVHQFIRLEKARFYEIVCSMLWSSISNVDKNQFLMNLKKVTFMYTCKKKLIEEEGGGTLACCTFELQHLNSKINFYKHQMCRLCFVN